MAVSVEQREQQVKQAEELLFAGPQKLGFAKGLYFGQFVADWIMPYPELSAEERPKVEQAVAELRQFANESIDATAIDRSADIPQSVIDGLARLGVLGMTAPAEFGGKGFSQSAYCRVLEVLGGHCSATSIFVNAHHSIGIRALLLFGTEDQKARWLPSLVSGERLGAFALTEPQAGSDAANVQTRAVPSYDGTSYVLNGEKRYITNGGIAGVLTVMARTPVPGRDSDAVTAFLVTPDLPGFEVTEARMEKLGIRGTATAKLAFRDMAVPADNILGPLGKGLKVALTVLDFGRTTFGACCTGAAKTCLELAIAHARDRKQFGRTLSEFELVQKKIAQMASFTYAMEAMTYVTASMIDRGLEDYMLETAMLKVWSTEALWTMVNDTFQLYGGAAYFTDKPLERMLRDARINQIGEGANDVLRSFIALVGMRGPGEQLKDVWDALHKPLSGLGTMWRFGTGRLSAAVKSPNVPVRHPELAPYATQLSRLIKAFNGATLRAMVRHREEILERQLDQERIAEAAMELFASSCALSRLDAELSRSAPANGDPLASKRQRAAAEYFLQSSARRVRRYLAELRDNDDTSLLRAAGAWLHEPQK